MKKSTKRIFCILAVIIILALLIGSYMATRKPEPAAVPVPTATNTPTEVPTLPPTETPETPETPTPTALVLMTATPVPTEEPVATPEPTATAVPEPTAEPTEEPVITEEPAVEPTEIPEVTSTPAPTEEPEETPVPTATSVPEPTVTPTPEPTATSTPTPEPTSTPVPTATSTPKPTATPTPEPTPATKEPYLKWWESAMKRKDSNFNSEMTHFVMDGLNEKAFCFEVGNYLTYYSITEDEYYASNELDYKMGIDISISDTTIVEISNEDSFKLSQDGDRYCLGMTPSFRLKPLNPGTVEVTVTLYEVEYKKHESYWEPAYISFTDAFDTFTFTVEVEEFESNTVFNAGDFVPAENGYPVLVKEERYGENIYFSVWSNGKEGKEYDAVAVFTGTGEMWTWEECEQYTGESSSLYGTKITSLYISEGITKTTQLDGCGNLTYVSFPSTLKVIGEATLSGAIKLKELVIPEGVERIESRAFSHSDSLESVQLPNTLKYIGMLAFGHSGSGSYSYSSMKELRIPASVEYIGYDFISMRENITIIFEDGEHVELDPDWVIMPEYQKITIIYE